jgi:3-phenylpropionate/cinnamic acid dioxygenase small subunit
MTSSVKEEVEDFLFKEAALLDEHRYDEWLELWSPEGVYFVPCNEDESDPKQHVSLIYDDDRRRRERVWRLTHSGAVYAQDPPSRLCRVIGNVQLDLSSADGEVLVDSKFVLVDLRRGKQRILAGKQRHRLRRENGSFKIVEKKVVLLNNDEPFEVGQLVYLL